MKQRIGGPNEPSNNFLNTGLQICKRKKLQKMFFMRDYVKKDNYVLGVARDKDILNPQPSDRHKEFPRRKYGCKTCNVALCHTCWDPYHAEYNGIADTVLDTKKWK